MKKEISIVWFRQDLRIQDNPAIANACKEGQILPIYILDDCAPEPFKLGSTTKICLHHSLHDLNKSLHGRFNLYVGKAAEIIKLLIKQYSVKNIFWNICYEPWHITQENEVKKLCEQLSTKWNAFNSNYLWMPDAITKDDGSYYRVFTAYKNKSFFIPQRPKISLSCTPHFVKDSGNTKTLSELNLIPEKKWHKDIEHSWKMGESAAQKKLQTFLNHYLVGYKEGRNNPDKNQTSMLSPHLHFGEISPSQILQALEYVDAPAQDKESFINEIIWREFSCYLLHHFPTLHRENFDKKFNKFSWQNNSDFLKAWQTGNTGYPLIDAGMRQLWRTGYMHNRVRMIVGSFLVKNLNIHWHHGRDWFWDCLVDADLANNSASWQWVAGCGVDAAPYFRIFNPTTQGEKFDTHGDYTKKFVPELKDLPDKYLFKPWTAPEKILKSAGVTLGENYPKPIIDLSFSRKKALEYYADL